MQGQRNDKGCVGYSEESWQGYVEAGRPTQTEGQARQELGIFPRLCRGGIGCRRDRVHGQCWSISGSGDEMSQR